MNKNNIKKIERIQVNYKLPIEIYNKLLEESQKRNMSMTAYLILVLDYCNKNDIINFI